MLVNEAVVQASAELAATPRAERLKLTEIFLSLQGESTLMGLPTVFVRLTGCPLRCGYCDTEYAFYGGQHTSIDAVVQQVQDFGVAHTCVTGGEPLAQKNCLALLKRLCDQGQVVSLETSGALPVDDVDARVIRIVDIKTPGSGEVSRNHWPNLSCLNARDQIKFVLCDRADYEWAVGIIEQHKLSEICTVLLSPVAAKLSPRDLANWIIADRLPVRFQLQLHKILWGDTPGR